ncbi:MAG TPA: hypothetical protein VFU95_04175 [Telluria sp.]|nr:hypothetical protein [Telluria sp.]
MNGSIPAQPELKGEIQLTGAQPVRQKAPGGAGLFWGRKPDSDRASPRGVAVFRAPAVLVFALAAGGLAPKVPVPCKLIWIVFRFKALLLLIRLRSSFVVWLSHLCNFPRRFVKNCKLRKG